ncbi:MAG: MFS transporter [Burkholderiales bacterium]|nr:MFS transporter [Burkholderiales bacterium]
MSSSEIRASVSLAAIFALRMLGLFLILPVFAVHAKSHLVGGENATLVGIAMGAMGLAQAFFHVPLGMASDRYGRKPVIVCGLVIFAIGSFIAAGANDIFVTILGRVLQGMGAISAAVMALVADSTRDEHRTKAMAMVGGSIGVAFAVSLVGAPLLYRWIGMDGIFNVTGVLAFAAILVVLFVVPSVPSNKTQSVSLASVLKDRELMRLNYGVFALHVTQIAVFVVVPGAIVQYVGWPVSEHWKIYLPVVLLSFFLMLPPIFIGEKQGKMKHVFVGAIALLLLVQLGMWSVLAQPVVPSAVLIALLLAFFVAFNILEAAQPSTVSRVAPPSAKGAALGVYNTLQSLGVAVGGFAGGWLKQHADASKVFMMAAGLTLVWLIIVFKMKGLPRRGT